MKETILFRSRNGTPVTDSDILRALEQTRAGEANYLFVHSDLSFGTPNPELGKKELLGKVWQAVRATGVPTICFPTFTFSFCNNEDYDVRNTLSRMGALNEYVRRLPEAERSRDPLMSVAAVGKDMSVIRNLGRYSGGVGSTFHKLHEKGGAKFLFLGVSPSKCMTHVHYVEERRGVPYRYHRDFTGNVIDGSGVARETYTLYLRYRGVVASERGEVENCLLQRGQMLRAPCGDAFVSVVAEEDVFQAVMDLLDKDIDCLLAEPYPRDALDPFFEPHKMVAL